ERLLVEVGRGGLAGGELLADRLERLVLGQPQGAALQRALHVVAADRHEDGAEAPLVELEEIAAMVVLHLRHLAKHPSRRRIAAVEILGEAVVDARVLLLGGDRHRENLALVELGETFHGCSVWNSSNVGFRTDLNKARRARKAIVAK